MSSTEILMPVVTEHGEDGVVTAWMVKEGARVVAGQLIAEVQAEKVAQNVEASTDGYVVGLVAINEPVAQGERICSISDTAPGVSAPAAETPGGVTSPPVRTPASPSARRVAKELGIDLATVAGTGPSGRITEDDVRTAGASAPVMSGLRATIARNMRESIRTTAPVTLTTTVDVTESLPDMVTARVVHCAAAALADHPWMNGTREGDRFVPAADVRVSLAIQTDEGLVAPVLTDPSSMTVAALDGAIRSLADRARGRELTGGDFAGGTFSVTNLGSYGVDAFTPIINPPQVAILGVGAIRQVPGYEDGMEIVPRRLLTLSLTFDHAFVDGAPAAAYLAQVRGALEQSPPQEL